MIQRFPFRVFATALIAAGGGRHAHGAEVVALAPGPDASKSVIGKAHSLSARFTHYRLQSFGNLCDMN
jgi:hypothetical protein